MHTRIAMRLTLLLCLYLGSAGCTFHLKAKKVHNILDKTACQTGYALTVMEREYKIRAEMFKERIQPVIAPDGKKHRRLSKRLEKMSRMLERAKKDRKRMQELDAEARALFDGKKKISNRDPKWDTLEKLRDEYEKIANRMHKAGSRFANALIDFDRKASTVRNAAFCRDAGGGSAGFEAPQSPK
jgi:hypothetical protein